MKFLLIAGLGARFCRLKQPEGAALLAAQHAPLLLCSQTGMHLDQWQALRSPVHPVHAWGCLDMSTALAMLLSLANPFYGKAGEGGREGGGG